MEKHAQTPHDDQQLVPYGDQHRQGVYIVDDASMGSQNGGPLVVFPDDRLGPTEEHPQWNFYIHAPQFNWWVVGQYDEVARMGMHPLAHEAFQFGCQVEAHQIYLCDSLYDAE